MFLGFALVFFTQRSDNVLYQVLTDIFHSHFDLWSGEEVKSRDYKNVNYLQFVLTSLLTVSTPLSLNHQSYWSNSHLFYLRVTNLCWPTVLHSYHILYTSPYEPL